jgi:hypothetical protein
MPSRMSAEPEMAPPLLRTHSTGWHPSMKNAAQQVMHASGVLDSCVEPKISTSVCAFGSAGGARSNSRAL